MNQQYNRIARDILAPDRAFPLFYSFCVGKGLAASFYPLIRTVSKHCYYCLGLHPIRDMQMSRLHRFGLLVLVRVMRTGRCPPVYLSAADLIMMHSTELDACPLGRDRTRKQSLLSEAKAGRGFLHHRRSSLELEDQPSRQLWLLKLHRRLVSLEIATIANTALSTTTHLEEMQAVIWFLLLPASNVASYHVMNSEWVNSLL